jgi:hypothetical protein
MGEFFVEGEKALLLLRSSFPSLDKESASSDRPYPSDSNSKLLPPRRSKHLVRPPFTCSASGEASSTSLGGLSRTRALLSERVGAGECELFDDLEATVSFRPA